MAANKKSIHDGHRERVRQEFLANGFNDATPPHKILEMLLFFGKPRGDTNEIAHKLLNEFGSLAAVFEAKPEELMKVDGVGENIVALIKLMPYVVRSYTECRKPNLGSGNAFDFENIYEYIENKYIGFTDEVFAISTFNNRGEFLAFDILAEGDNSEVKISIRKVIETIIKRNASYAIISHNHPGGMAMPSHSDLEMTERINTSLKSIGVNLIDHIIVVEGDYVSLRQSQAYAYLFK